MLPCRVPPEQRGSMALVFQFEEIAPGSSSPSCWSSTASPESVEAHYKLYEGYVAKRNEILGKLDGADLEARTRRTPRSAL